MRVVSVDPAPSKPSVVCDGECFKEIEPADLPQYCLDLKVEPTLLVWDAPLTGPPSRNSLRTHPSPYSQRIIEQFFSRTSLGFKSPAGISVLPYSGCPHWTITRASLGLPIVGGFDTTSDELPYTLVCSPDDLRDDKSLVVESHPALAIWLWCKEIALPVANWRYKGNKAAISVMGLWTLLLSTLDRNCITFPKPPPVPSNDDELDAVVGWMLGILLLDSHLNAGPRSAMVLGNIDSGAFLVPYSQQLESAFDDFATCRGCE